MLQANDVQRVQELKSISWGEKLDCGILEVAARVLKDTASAECTGCISDNATHGAAHGVPLELCPPTLLATRQL